MKHWPDNGNRCLQFGCALPYSRTNIFVALYTKTLYCTEKKTSYTHKPIIIFLTSPANLKSAFIQPWHFFQYKAKSVFYRATTKFGDFLFRCAVIFTEGHNYKVFFCYNSFDNSAIGKSSHFDKTTSLLQIARRFCHVVHNLSAMANATMI